MCGEPTAAASLPAAPLPGDEPSAAASGAKAEIRVRLLEDGDLPRAARLASAAFRKNPFYQAALGLDPPAFDEYWWAFLPLAMDDPYARVHGIESRGTLVGVLVSSTHGFPQRGSGLRFLCRLARRIGGRRLCAYLRFVRTYETALRRPRREREREARGLWLLVAPGQGAGLGSRLTRRVIREYEQEGRTISTALADGGNLRLLDFYGRLGFTVRDRIELGGGEAVVFERRGRPPTPCLDPASAADRGRPPAGNGGPRRRGGSSPC